MSILISHEALQRILAERATQVVAAGTTISVTDGAPVTPFTTSGSVDNTAQPFIAAGRDGQFVILRNDNGSATLTLHDTYTGVGGSLLRLSAANVVMAAGSAMGLIYSATVGAWVQQWYLAPVAVTPAINTFTVDGSAAIRYLEWGDGVTANAPAPAFVASYTGVPSAAQAYLDYPTVNGTAWSAPYTSKTGAAYARSATRNAQQQWSLRATVNGSPLVSGNVTVQYLAPNYYGISTQTAGLTSAQVVALSRVLDIDPFNSYAVNAAGATDYIWVAFVDNDATLDTNLFFAINGERARFDLKDNPVSVTGTYGKVANYETYRSLLAQLGSVTVVAQSSRPPTRRYVGKSAGATQRSEAQIEALQLSDLVESPNGTFAGITGLGTGDYIWFCVPAVVAAPANYGLAPGASPAAGDYEQAAFTAMAVQSVTNAYGFTDASVKNIHSDVTNLNAINIKGATSTTWSLKTQAAAFPARSFVGPHTASAISSGQILTLDDTANGTSMLQASLAGSYAVVIAGSNYLWVCHPSTVADIVTIKDQSTGFSIAGSYRTNVSSHVTDFGVTIPTMRVWRSDNVGIFPSGGTVVIT